LRDGRVRPDVRDLDDEAREQAIALLDAGDRAPCEEAVAQVANRALDFALLARLASQGDAAPVSAVPDSPTWSPVGTAVSGRVRCGASRAGAAEHAATHHATMRHPRFTKRTLSPE